MIDEDGTTGSLGFTVSDPTVAAANLTVTATSNNTTVIPAANVVLGGSGGNRTVTVTAAPDQFGSATITLTVMNGAGGTASSSFDVTVLAINDAPTISNITDQTTAEGTATSAIAFTVGDTETPVANLTVTATSSNTALIPNSGLALGGTGANRTITVTPAATGNGTSTITVSVSDGTTTVTDTFVVTVVFVSGPNDPPVNTVPGAQSTNEDTALVFNGANAISISDIDAGAAAVQVTLGVANTTGNVGTLTLAGVTGLTFTSGDGTADTSMVFSGTISAINTALAGLSLTPPSNASGTGTLTIVTNDLGNTGTGGALSDSDTVALSVVAVNDLPTISQIANQTIAEDTNTGALAFTIGDVETAAGTLTVTATSSNTALIPTANVVAGGTGANRTVTVTPVADGNGSSIITLTVNDGTGTTSMSFTVTVTGVNDAPTIQNVADQSTNVGQPITVPFTISDADAANVLTVTATSSNAGVSGTPVLGGAGNSRTVTLSAPAGGTATITLTVSDGTLSATDTFVLTVNNFNDAPVNTVPGTLTLHAPAGGGTLSFAAGQVSVTDPDAGALNIEVTITATNGTLSATAPTMGSLTGSGTSTLVYTAPQAAIRTSLSTLTFTSAAAFAGTATVTMTTSDLGNSGTPTVVLTDVDSFNIVVNQVPTFSGVNASYTVAEDGSVTVTFTVADANGLVANVATTASSDNTGLVANNLVVTGTGASRSVTISPLANQNNETAGPAVITLTATDSAGGVGTTSFTFNVTQVNDAPAITPIGAQTSNEDTALVFSTGNGNAITFTDIDLTEANGVPGPTGHVTMVLVASTGTLTLAGQAGLTNESGNGTGTIEIVGSRADVLAAVNGLSLTPAPNQSGAGTLSIDLNDRGNAGAGGVLSDTETVAFSFTAVNDAPTLVARSGLTTLTANTPRTGINVEFADVDAGAATNLSVTINAMNGTVTLSPATVGALTFTTGDGTADANMVFSGSLANLNTALASFTFTPNAAFVGDARIDVTLNDAGNVGTGGARVLTTNVLTTYSASVNTAPTISDVADATVVEDNSTGALAFTVADGQTNPGNLDVSFSSSDTANWDVVLGGSGANRTVTATPHANVTSQVTVTLTVSDGVATDSSNFTVTVTAVNDAPTLIGTGTAGAIPAQTTNEDTNLFVGFTASDVETALDSSNMNAFSDNPALITITSLNQGGLVLVPTANQSGSATVTVTASDGSLVATRLFTITVVPVNDAPTITGTGQIVVADIEQTSVRLVASMSSGETVSLGTTANVTFCDANSDGVVDGDGVNDQLLCINGAITAVNAAVDDLVSTGGTLTLTVNDLTSTATASASTTRTGVFGPN